MWETHMWPNGREHGYDGWGHVFCLFLLNPKWFNDCKNSSIVIKRCKIKVLTSKFWYLWTTFVASPSITSVDWNAYRAITSCGRICQIWACFVTKETNIYHWRFFWWLPGNFSGISQSKNQFGSCTSKSRQVKNFWFLL